MYRSGVGYRRHRWRSKGLADFFHREVQTGFRFCGPPCPRRMASNGDKQRKGDQSPQSGSFRRGEYDLWSAAAG